MKIAIGNDHGGIMLKKAIMDHFKKGNVEWIDVGVTEMKSVDYPDIAQQVADQILSGKAERGILLCGTGIGIGIAANKIAGIRAALCHDVYSAIKSREHNDANILTMGERVIGPGLGLLIVEEWLKAEFEGGRHEQRVLKIKKLEGLGS